jgi:hypothetical protein
VPWWPTGLSMDEEAVDSSAIDKLLHELDAKIRQEEHEASQALRARRLSSGQQAGAPSDVAAAASSGNLDGWQMPLPNLALGTYALNDDGQVVLSPPALSSRSLQARWTEKEGVGEREADTCSDKTSAEAKIEALLPWLAIASHRYKFSKVFSMVNLYRKYTRALTYENVSSPTHC